MIFLILILFINFVNDMRHKFRSYFICTVFKSLGLLFFRVENMEKRQGETPIARGQEKRNVTGHLGEKAQENGNSW